MNFKKSMALSLMSIPYILQPNSQMMNPMQPPLVKVPMYIQEAPTHAANKAPITGPEGQKGFYNPSEAKAWLKDSDGSVTHYKNVVTISGPYTPPKAVMQGKVKYFASMPNPEFEKQPKGLIGGPSKVIQLYGKKIKNSKANTKKTDLSQQESSEFAISGISSNLQPNNLTGEYNPEFKAAWLLNPETKERTYFSDIIEYKQATTPPNITNPSLVAFATMPNPDYTGLTVAGGQKKIVTLYGKPIATTHFLGKAPKKPKTGFMNQIASQFQRKGLNPPPLAPGPVIPQQG